MDWAVVGLVLVVGAAAIRHREAVATQEVSRREEAESSLRKDMLVSIIDSFLRPAEGDLDAKVGRASRSA